MKELRNVYPMLSIIKIIKSKSVRAGRVAQTGENRNTFRLLVGKSEGKGSR
jgi:hypothetical protein